MGIKNSIESFHKSIELASERLRSNTFLIEDKKEKIKRIMEGLRLEKNIDIEENASEIKKICKRQEEEYISSVTNWVKKVQNYLETKEFVNQFEKSLLLMVFGDVKAGKSQLGNFISGYYFKNTKYSDLNTHPKFYKYDSSTKENTVRGKEELKESCFVVDVIEATATIQYFTLLEGLTWVDTPGIHSLTTENQELANEYIKYADLILFLTPSNNPCKQDENNEIKRLIDANKPMLLTITKSDNVVRDIVNGISKSVLKPKDTRKKQEDFVKSVIESIEKNDSIQHNKYISISSKMAIKAIEEDDEVLYEQSNIDDFLNQLNSVLSEKSIELKMRRPKDELNFVISELINGDKKENSPGIDVISNNINNILNEIKNQKLKLDDIKVDVMDDIKADVMSDINTVMSANVATGQISNKDDLSEKVFQVLKRSINKILNQRIGDILSDFKKYTINTYSIDSDIKYEKKYDTIEYQIYDVKTVSRPPEGIIENFLHLFGKEYTTSKIVTITENKKIEVGDNYNEMFLKYFRDLELHIESIVDKEVDKIKNEYFKTMEDIFNNILKSLDNARTELNSMKF